MMCVLYENIALKNTSKTEADWFWDTFFFKFYEVCSYLQTFLAQLIESLFKTSASQKLV